MCGLIMCRRWERLAFCCSLSGANIVAANARLHTLRWLLICRTQTHIYVLTRPHAVATAANFHQIHICTPVWWIKPLYQRWDGMVGGWCVIIIITMVVQSACHARARAGQAKFNINSAMRINNPPPPFVRTCTRITW